MMPKTTVYIFVPIYLAALKGKRRRRSTARLSSLFSIDFAALAWRGSARLAR